MTVVDPKTCWKASEAAPSLPCRQPVVSDAGLCQQHLEQLRDEPEDDKRG